MIRDAPGRLYGAIRTVDAQGLTCELLEPDGEVAENTSRFAWAQPARSISPSRRLDPRLRECQSAESRSARFIIGLAQALTLGLRAQTLAIWVGGTAVALAVALAAVTAAIGRIETSIEAIALGVAAGVLIGAAQAAVLMRAGVPSAWLWIPVTGVAWGVGWLITSGIGVALAPGWPVYGLSGAVVSQIITAVALWRVIPSRDTLRSAE